METTPKTQKLRAYYRCPYDYKHHIVDTRFWDHIERCRSRGRGIVYLLCECQEFVQVDDLQAHHLRCYDYQKFIFENSLIDDVFTRNVDVVTQNERQFGEGEYNLDLLGIVSIT